MKTVRLTLAGQGYTVNELPRKKNAAWREQFQQEFVTVAEAIAAAAETDTSQAGNIAEILRGLMNQIDGAVDKLLGLLAAYAPSVAADIGRVEEEAFESELIDAFVEVLGLAYPFGRAIEALGSLTSPGPRFG